MPSPALAIFIVCAARMSSKKWKEKWELSFNNILTRRKLPS